MSIKEALLRRSDRDIITIGEIADGFYNSEGGELLRAVINGRITDEATKRDVKTPAERTLGRIEALQGIIDDFELMIKQGQDAAMQAEPYNKPPEKETNFAES